jgi:hypothetical protein
MQKLLHAVDILCINYYEAFQRKKRANSWNDCHSRIACLDSKSVMKNLLGFRACNFQHVSLASGLTVFSSCGADPSKAKKRLSSPNGRLLFLRPQVWSWALDMLWMMTRSTRRVGAPSGRGAMCPGWTHTPAPGRCKQLGYTGQATGEAEWCPEASSRAPRGDAKQPRRRARRAGALTRGGIFVPPRRI